MPDKFKRLDTCGNRINWLERKKAIRIPPDALFIQRNNSR